MKIFILLLPLTCFGFVSSGYIYDKDLGTECLYDEDCVTRNSFCKGNKICACKIGYQYDRGSDICFPKEVNLKCSEDYDCSALQNARCTYGRCQCKFDYVPSRDRGACLPTMRLTSLCEEDSQCNSVMNRSYCDPVMRHCVCDRGLMMDSYRMLCIQNARLHTLCTNDEDCFGGNATLRGVVQCKEKEHFLKFCECADGYIERNDTCVNGGSLQAVLSSLSIIAVLVAKWMD